MSENKTVLVVEDEAALRNLLHDKLLNEGFKVLVAENGKVAIELALREHPVLILLDLLLPEMSGLQVMRLLRADGWGKNVTVIVLTNVNKQEEIAEAVMSGTYEYIVKSDWKLDDVVAKVKEKLLEKPD